MHRPGNCPDKDNDNVEAPFSYWGHFCETHHSLLLVGRESQGQAHFSATLPPLRIRKMEIKTIHRVDIDMDEFP